MAVEHQRQRARPECPYQHTGRLGYVRGPIVEPVRLSQVNDQGMACRSLLDGENPRHGLRIRSIGGEAVDGFSRNRHHGTTGEQVDAVIDIARVTHCMNFCRFASMLHSTG